MSDAAPLGDDELAAWLRLLYTPGITRGGARRLLAACGPPPSVLAAAPSLLRQCVGADAAQALAEPPPEHGERLAATRAWLRGAPRRRVMVLGDADYPPLLLNTADPPLLLYLDGDARLLNRPALAVVGSRRPTPQGLETARAFGRGLCRHGYVVVSGLAAGVDGAAHEGALQALDQDPDAGGNTVAVMGTGIDVPYPRSHRGLTARIAARGLLVSEMPLGTPPLPHHFPQRNRIIAGLARGTLVVEAALASGSLITARLAADAGREVMAIPGSIHSPHARGCHELIRQGAALVQSVDDVLAELGGAPRQPDLPLAPAGPASDSPDAAADDPVLRALGHDPASLDLLVARCGWPAPALSAHLLALELDGRVARLPGGLYQRVSAG